MKKSLFLAILFFITNVSYAETTEKESPFLPTWRLLNSQDKKQFISGYQHGWRDAVKIIDIVITYLKSNPTEGIKALESMRDIYNTSDLHPDELIRGIDAFYADPSNSAAPLSKAITAAKQRK